MKVSVLMPVYNREAYVKEAIESILSQTYEDFELIIIDDCSTDRTIEVIEAIEDSRIHLIKNITKGTIPQLRNQAVSLAKGEYIAFMDSDDVAALNRLEKEVAFLETHPDHAAVSSFYHVFGDRDFTVELPLSNEEICGFLMVRCVMANGSCMIRRKVYEYASYKEDYFVAEDYDFWVQLIGRTKLANIPEVLLEVRFGEQQTTRQSANEIEKQNRKKAIITQIHREVFQQLNIDVTQEEMDQYIAFLLDYRNVKEMTVEGMREIRKNYQTIMKAMERVHPEYVKGFTEGMSLRYKSIDFNE